MGKVIIKFIAFALGYIIGTILWKIIIKIINRKKKE